jgi:hypothetical protein
MGLALDWLAGSGAFRLWPSALATEPGAKAATGGKRPPELKPEPALPGLLAWKIQIAISSSNAVETTIILRIILEGLLVVFPFQLSRGKS